MTERGIIAELLAKADEQIEVAKEKGTQRLDDLEKYRANAERRRVWEEVKIAVKDLRQKYQLEDDDDA